MTAGKNALLILSPGFPENEADSTCLPSQQLLVRSLNRLYPNLPVIIVSFQYPFTRKEYQWHGNRVIALGGANKNGIRRRITWYRAWKVLRQIRRQQALLGIFSFWCTECALVGKRFAKFTGLPHYIWILGQDAKKSNAFVKRIRPTAENLVALSTTVSATFFRNHGISPGHLIPNGIEPSLFPVKALPRDIDILGAGSLIPLKQYDQFITVCRQLLNKKPDARMMLCGKGPLEEALRRQLAEMGLEHHLILTGELPHPKLLEMMSRSHLFLHPSNYEGFSTVCLEALYAGARVISFCDPGTGAMPDWYIARDAGDMSSIATRLLSAPPLPKPVHFPFTMDETAARVMRLYGYAVPIA